MISGDRWKATYEYETTRADGTPWMIHYSCPVAFFDNEGDGWIVDNETLQAADSLPGFTGYEESERIVAIVPLPAGVRLRYKDGQGNQFTSPLGMWGLKANGSVELLDSDDRGVIEPVSEAPGFVGLECPHDDTTEASDEEGSPAP